MSEHETWFRELTDEEFERLFFPLGADEDLFPPVTEDEALSFVASMFPEANGQDGAL